MKMNRHIIIFAATCLVVNAVLTAWAYFGVGILDSRLIVLSIFGFPFLAFTESIKPYGLVLLIWIIFLWPLIFTRHLWGRIVTYISLALVLALDGFTVLFICLAMGID